MTMRSLSISETLRWHSSEQRMPVEYSVITMVRRIRFSAESITRSTSFGLRMTGNCLGRLGNGMCSGRYGRRSVLT